MALRKIKWKKKEKVQEHLAVVALLQH
jgi:hypothetical protein